MCMIERPKTMKKEEQMSLKYSSISRNEAKMNPKWLEQFYLDRKSKNKKPFTKRLPRLN